MAPETDRLLREVLCRAGPDSPSGEHLDHETIALFVEGGLGAGEKEPVASHLADCEECRQLASAVIEGAATAGEEEDLPILLPSGERRAPIENETDAQTRPRPPRRARWVNPVLGLAATAAVVLVFGFWWKQRPPEPQLAESEAFKSAERLITAADFDRALEVLGRARDKGVDSDRLRNLEAQAYRQLPGRLALVEAGRLTDFGFELDGTQARGGLAPAGLDRARAILDSIESESVEVLLNRAHLRLTQRDYVGATRDFTRAAELAPLDTLPILGLGLAAYLQGDTALAETRFRNCLELDPGNLAAQINLAMTLA
jgi:tetratricopeptide (TPR) repeat protein